MAFDLVIKELAAHQTIEAYLYYENESAGVGEQFIAALRDTYEKIAENPEYYSLISDKGTFRDVKIKGFPYVVIYNVAGSTMLIYSIHNSYRKARDFR